MEKRRFHEKCVNHVYQRTLSGFNIFYDVEDYLVYFTVFSVLAVKYNIVVYGLCLMIDHIHSLFFAKDMKTLSGFVSHVTLSFVKEYNSAHGRKGPLFEGRFGSAPKRGLKLLRTAIAYLYNNPVEKLLCRKAQDFKWNFLAYAHSDHPFSHKLVIRNAPYRVRRIIKEIDYEAKCGRHLSYAMLNRFFSDLDKDSKDQIIDYIITRYSVIRYDLLESCYGGYENMLAAINSNAGSEFDINETMYVKSDKEYRELYRYVREHGFRRAGDVIGLPDADKYVMCNELSLHTSASRVQIAKFLHFNVKCK